MNDNLQATVTLTNQGPNSMPVQVSLFSLSSERFDLAPLTLEGNTVRVLNLADHVPADRNFREGSVQITYTGRNFELGGFVRLVDAEKSLSFDEELVEAAAVFASSRLEAVWWLPSGSAAARLILSNTTELPLSATTTFTAGVQTVSSSENSELMPHETRVIDMHDAVSRSGATPAQFGGISIKHTGVKGALLARILVSEESSGYSSAVDFSDPRTAKSSRLDGAGLRLGMIAGDEVRPVVLARNIGSEPATLTGRVPYTTHGGGLGTITLSPVRLAAGQTREIPMLPAIKANGIDQSAEVAGLEFEYTGTPGSVVMSAQSVSRSGKQVFRVPLVDSLARASSTGFYPWSIEGSSSTVVNIKNATEHEQHYTMQINFSGGVYALGRQTIAGGETKAFDLRAIRDNQVPDQDGATLPLDASSGRVDWSVERYEEGPQPLTMIGRAEQVDFINGMASTSSCGGCCSNAYSFSFMSPGSGSCPVGGTFQFHAMQVNEDCFGNLSAPFVVTLGTWTSSNTAVATSAGGGLMNGVSEGNVTVTKKWTTFTTGDGDPNATCNSGKIFPFETGPLQVMPTVSISSLTATPMTSRVSGTSTVTVQVAASPGVPPMTMVDVQLLLDSKSDQNIQVAATLNKDGAVSTMNTGVAVSPNSPGSSTFTVGTTNMNQTMGMITYRAFITAVNNTGTVTVTIGTPVKERITIDVP